MLPPQHKSTGKPRGVKEHKNSCRDKGARLSLGPDPGQGMRRSHLRAIFGLDLVSEHLKGSRRKRTQAGGRASPTPRLISAADSQMLICHFRSRVKEIKGREGKKMEKEPEQRQPLPLQLFAKQEHTGNGPGLDWSRASLQDPARDIPQSQKSSRARQGRPRPTQAKAAPRCRPATSISGCCSPALGV